jgi:hypothetical protein
VKRIESDFDVEQENVFFRRGMTKSFNLGGVAKLGFFLRGQCIKF